MIFEEGFIYHLFNQGNNKQRIFYNDDTTYSFLKKLENI